MLLNMDDIINCPKCNSKNQSVFVIFIQGMDNFVEYKLYYICICGQEYLKRFKEYVDYGYKTLHTT